MLRTALCLTSLMTTVALAACSPAARPATEASESAEKAADPGMATGPEVVVASSASASAGDMTGRWTGVEGTWLVISPTMTGYDVEIADLDGPRTFKGRAEGDTIVIERDGASLAIKRGNGVQTGMKWLADKQDCVIVAAYEGYCRD